jgi:hypothetical protein
MKLVNFRLSDEDAAKVQVLREGGVRMSDLLRQAIRTAYVTRARPLPPPKEIRAILQKIQETYPDPPNLPPRGFDLRDRKAVSAHIAARIQAKTFKP